MQENSLIKQRCINQVCSLSLGVLLLGMGQRVDAWTPDGYPENGDYVYGNYNQTDAFSPLATAPDGIPSCKMIWQFKQDPSGTSGDGKGSWISIFSFCNINQEDGRNNDSSNIGKRVVVSVANQGKNLPDSYDADSNYVTTGYEYLAATFGIGDGSNGVFPGMPYVAACDPYGFTCFALFPLPALIANHYYPDGMPGTWGSIEESSVLALYPTYLPKGTGNPDGFTPGDEYNVAGVARGKALRPLFNSHGNYSPLADAQPLPRNDGSSSLYLSYSSNYKTAPYVELVNPASVPVQQAVLTVRNTYFNQNADSIVVIDSNNQVQFVQPKLDNSDSSNNSTWTVQTSTILDNNGIAISTLARSPNDLPPSIANDPYGNIIVLRYDGTLWKVVPSLDNGANSSWTQLQSTSQFPTGFNATALTNDRAGNIILRDKNNDLWLMSVGIKTNDASNNCFLIKLKIPETDQANSLNATATSISSNVDGNILVTGKVNEQDNSFSTYILTWDMSSIHFDSTTNCYITDCAWSFVQSGLVGSVELQQEASQELTKVEKIKKI